jgi:hypothetical protein
MSASWKSEWNALRRGKPGRRFVERYEASHRARDRGTVLGRIVRMVIAVLCLAVGVVLMFIPGPAILFYFVAGSLLATESRAIARLLDWIEVKLRKVATWLHARWKRLPTAGKVVVVLLVGAVSAAVMIAGYRLWTR